jgi:hypothetical protein
MDKDNKNTELNDTDKKLHISDVIKSLPTDDEIDKLIEAKEQELSSYWISGYWLRSSEAEEIMYKIRDEILKKVQGNVL